MHKLKYVVKTHNGRKVANATHAIFTSDTHFVQLIGQMSC